ncbi:flagellar hook-length control protein FliK [Oceanobacter mangrovi]|uniref:flagellar hook-length control protein FliK n=1 Tax=Oceanobacter mangrovi TaxID=2862510 RepID=UPI001C8EEF3F|nr:flagellar hook-length control protein FliK [Oceanobacter mangrovi]
MNVPSLASDIFASLQPAANPAQPSVGGGSGGFGEVLVNASLNQTPPAAALPPTTNLAAGEPDVAAANLLSGEDVLNQIKAGGNLSELALEGALASEAETDLAGDAADEADGSATEIGEDDGTAVLFGWMTAGPVDITSNAAQLNQNPLHQNPLQASGPSSLVANMAVAGQGTQSGLQGKLANADKPEPAAVVDDFSDDLQTALADDVRLDDSITPTSTKSAASQLTSQLISNNAQTAAVASDNNQPFNESPADSMIDMDLPVTDQLLHSERADMDDMLEFGSDKNNWGPALGGRLATMIAEDIQQARIQLDPPELGALEIQLTVDRDDQAHVQIHVHNPQVREVLESQAHRLRDALNGQGLSLASFDVSEQSGGQQGSDGQSGMGEDSGSGGSLADGFADGKLTADQDEPLQTVSLKDDRLVSTYA